MKKYIYLICLTLIAAGCEEEHPLKLDSQDQMLLLQCMSGLSDTTTISLHAATPVTQKDSIAPDISGAVISLKVNGQDKKVTKTEVPGKFISIGKLNTGDVVEVSAKAAGLTPVSGRTIVPAVISNPEVRLGKRAEGYYYTLHVDIPDAASDEYLGIKIIEESTAVNWHKEILYYGSDPEAQNHREGDLIKDTTYTVYSLPPYDIANEGLGMEMNEEAISVNFRDGDMLHFEDSWSYRGENTLYLISPGMRTNEGRTYECLFYKNDDYEHTEMFEDIVEYYSKRTYRYKVILYRLSPEFYRFAKARYDAEYNDLAEFGLTPSTFTYTNVKGGFGVVGAATSYDTGWLAKP